MAAPLYTLGRTTAKIFRPLTRSVRPGVRTFLSEAYSCSEAWNARLNAPVMKQIEPALFAMKLQEKLDKAGSASAIDFDMLANKLEVLDRNQLKFVQSLFQRFQKTQEAMKMQESTPYALVRALLKMGETDTLLEMIQDKLAYRIFLHSYTANILLDHFLRNKQYLEAAKVAADQMFQEDFSHPITKWLSWCACHHYWCHFLPKEGMTETEDAADDGQEEEEETLIAVPFIVEPFYDDHFDIPTLAQQIGKALVLIGQQHGQDLGRNYELIGWGLYHKFDQGIKLLNTVLETEGCSVAKSSLESFRERLEKLATQEPAEEKEPGTLTLEDKMPRITTEMKEEFIQQLQECTDKLEAQNKIKEVDLESQLMPLVQEEVPKYEEKDIKEQLELFEKWQQARDTLLKEQLKALKDRQMRFDIAKRLTELQAREERLSFFEQRDKISDGLMRAPVVREIQETKIEEQFVAAPGERGKL